MESEPISTFQFPPGFRFHPHDEELIVHYLLNKVNSRPLPASVIAEIELYNYNPWELPKKALFGEDEWYFFSPRDRKYPNGERPNRTAASGYWKATGTDKPILRSGSKKKIGLKKALVFYNGRPPKGIKTDWIMNEYRLPRPSKPKGSMRLDDWVLCRVRQKGNMSKNTGEVQDSPGKELTGCFPTIEELPSAHAYPNTNFITDYGYRGCQVLASILAGQPLPSIENISSETFQTSYGGNSGGSLYEEGSDKGNSPAGQPLPSIENISSEIFKTSYGGNSGGSLYEEGSDKGNSAPTDSFFDTIFNAAKGKSNEGAGYENLLPYTKMVTNNKANADLLPGNTMNTGNANFYIRNQTQRDIFNLNPSNASLQGLNGSSFTGTFLQ